MKAPKIVEVACINPQPTQSYCEAGGIRRYYTNWDYPPNVTGAIGLGASGRSAGAFTGDPAPVLVCEDHGEYLVAIRQK